MPTSSHGRSWRGSPRKRPAVRDGTTLVPRDGHAPRSSKLGNARGTPGAFGRTYDSKREASYSWELYALLQAGEIAAVDFQKTIPLVVNGVKVSSRRMDFVVTRLDGRTELIEVKGFATEAYKIRQKLLEALVKDDPSIILTVVT